MSDTISQVPEGPVSVERPMPSEAAGPVPSAVPQRLRLWPAVVIITLQWLVVLVPAQVAPGTMFHFFGMFLGPIVGTAAVLAWWLFGSRLPWRERWLGLLTFGAITGVAFACFHSSMGMSSLLIYTLPLVTTASIVWLIVTSRLIWRTRRVGLIVILAAACGYSALIRFEGIDGSMGAAFHYRWQPTAEDTFLARIGNRARQVESHADVSAVEELALQPGDWPCFRGPERDGRLVGVRITTDWKERPPREVWRHQIGPGWSSFAVVGDSLFTQEQRGEDELVVCYDAATGAERWIHTDRARFMETLGGPGPRATPTFHEGKIYTLGATGLLNCLEAATGRAVWSRDIVKDSGAAVPQWGFSASPLVAAGVVTVFAGSDDEKSVLGYDAASGNQVWLAGEGKLSYCSTQLSKLCGVEQVVVATEKGATAFDPAGGKILWEHAWPSDAQRVIQPAIVGDSDVLIGTGFGMGLRRVHVGHQGEDWTTEEVWTTRAIKPYFNDLVVHGDYLYGFDSGLFTCVSLADGKLKWRVRGYGNGEVVLLADQDLLLVLSETGDVVLIDAIPDRHNERGRFKAIEGKTWNHPVVAHGKLFVRNGEEAACFELAAENKQ